ncbi:MAG TPA: hypothetical protein VF380_00820 [Solirubrobacteraceae bacterium]
MVFVPFKRSLAKRIGGTIPLAPLLLAGEMTMIAGRHIAKLDPTQRRRMLALMAQTRGRPGSLSEAERRELLALLAVLEPRLFLGSAVRTISPLPVPKRILYGPRGSDARKAAAAQR